MMSIRTTGIARAASIFAATALVAASAVPAFAAAPDPTTSTKSAKDAAKSDPATDKRRYCSVSKTTGTIMERKTCKTRAEWIAATGVDPARR